MTLKVQKWGNSLAVRFPRALLKMLDLSLNSAVDIEKVEGGLLIKPHVEVKYQLDQLVSEITDANCHEEFTGDGFCGRESW